jgi:hypothetical protein
MNNVYAEFKAPDLRLVRLLEGVKDDPNPTRRLLENAVEEINPDDPFGCWDLAGYLLDNREVIVCALIGRRQ